MHVEVKGSELIIKLPLNPNPRPSKSMKNLTVATTGGNVRTMATHNGKPITVGVNAYVPVN
jgi:hypothetical protein